MNGIICINKPSGITSFSVCSAVRKITGEKKCGHMGTLDPLARGVLPVMLGGATRFLDFYPQSEKGYRAEFVLGKITDTLDITGRVTGEYSVSCTAEDVERALSRFRGEITQIPPMYSAVSVGGQRLYELARQGKTAERPQRKAFIKRLELVGRDESANKYEIDVLCSKGTYIRTLIDDLGKVLGCGAVMTSLLRTEACGYTLEDCTEIDILKQAAAEKRGFGDYLISVDSALSGCGRITVSQAQSVRFKNGGALELLRLKDKTEPGELYRVYSPGGDFLGLGEAEQTELAVKRVYVK